MRSVRSTLRSWIIPFLLIGIAAALTAPWSYWVIKAAYDRDIVDNAIGLAHRVEIRVSQQQQAATLFQAALRRIGMVGGLPAAQQATTNFKLFEVSDTLKAELHTDPTVEEVVFIDLSAFPVINASWHRRDGTVPTTRWSFAELRRIVASGVQVAEIGGKTTITVPWIEGARAYGFTYLVFSPTALRNQFWEKEGSLVRRVVTVTAAALAILSAVGLYAYSTWLKVGRVERRAELTRQGLLAERGLTAAVLAHEIRNPLQALRFQLHSLRRQSVNTPERVTATADTIDAELSRIHQLVTDYLEHEKARTMRVQQVELGDAARGLQALMTGLFRQTDTDLIVDASPEPIHVVCDPHALRQVLMNLVINAQQAKGRGGRITLAVDHDESYGIIRVTDNGPGIPDEMRERLFKPFQTNKRDGHGIGLALVKRFVDNFGGNVAVDSQPGRGTTFTLKLLLEGHQPGAAEVLDAEPQHSLPMHSQSPR